MTKKESMVFGSPMNSSLKWHLKPVRTPLVAILFVSCRGKWNGEEASRCFWRVLSRPYSQRGAVGSFSPSASPAPQACYHICHVVDEYLSLYQRHLIGFYRKTNDLVDYINLGICKLRPVLSLSLCNLEPQILQRQGNQSLPAAYKEGKVKFIK